MDGLGGSRQSVVSTPSMSIMPSLNTLSGFSFPSTSAGIGGPPGIYPPSSMAAMSPAPQLFLPGAQYSVIPPALSPPRSMGVPGTSYSPLQSPGLGGASNLSPYPSPSNGVLGGASKQSLPIGRHLCAICEDAASGKHYGVYRCLCLCLNCSCEGCKGFFKRTVRKDLKYTCRENNNCIVDKRQRNRCQACRYQRCLQTGMKREAVQEERLTALEKAEMEAESTTTGGEMPIENILSAEMRLEARPTEGQMFEDMDAMSAFALSSVTDQLCGSLVDWAMSVPHFAELPTDDQIMLLKAGWNELFIASFAHRSTSLSDCLALSPTVRLGRGPAAEQVGLAPIYDRIITDLVTKMRTMCIDRVELGCLRVIVLFNPDAKGLQCTGQVESLREKVYLSLEEYCRRQYADDAGRFAKLLLRLPALRSIGLKCPSYLFLCQPCRAESLSIENYISLLLKSVYSV